MGPQLCSHFKALHSTELARCITATLLASTIGKKDSFFMFRPSQSSPHSPLGALFLTAEETASNMSGASGASLVSEEQRRAIENLIASLKQNTERGSGTLHRLVGIVEAMSDESPAVEKIVHSVRDLQRELDELRAANDEFSSQFAAAGSRSELNEVKRRLEAHQRMLSKWDERVRHCTKCNSLK
ncbi:unnamed protein product [Ostreobium quekettii]|uniref:Uncharacterized protein n=1 Tax=Ostreobium quekettii TaxID=121088 RepID=A0A8S1JBW5_9CHLO|nr:unnamed protein product [Ostreobium quekettii]